VLALGVLALGVPALEVVVRERVGAYGVCFSALLVNALPVAEMSSPAPAVA
jgi:hypothetical protein